MRERENGRWMGMRTEGKVYDAWQRETLCPGGGCKELSWLSDVV